MEDAGLYVTEQAYQYYGKRVINVIATPPATTGESAYYVVGAHYDTVATTPGADDNASAVAVMLELARRLAEAKLKAPVVFAAFTLEAIPRSDRSRGITSAQLHAIGLQLMAKAENAALAAGRVTIEDALTYRDGLIIALLAAVPLRRRTLAALTINQHLVKIGGCWLLDIPVADTKTRRPLEFPISDDLSERIDLYLARFRNAITGANDHQGLWASARGKPMCGGAIYDAIRRRTTEALGFPVNLHRFRQAAGNLWSISDPVNVRGVKDLLGQSHFGTTEKHYIGAQSRVAGRALAKVLRSP